MGYGGGVRPIKFFRTIIGGLSGQEILEYLDNLKSDADKIQDKVLARVDGLFDQMTSAIKLKWYQQIFGNIIMNSLKKKTVDKIMDVLKENLKVCKL